jgi:hypothetical protein
MAERNVPKSVRKEATMPLVEVVSYEWGTKAKGTREQLIAAGLCSPAHFPEGRKRSIYGAGYWMEKKGTTWTLSINAPESERESRRKARLDREAREKRIEAMPRTPVAWREGKAFPLRAAIAAISMCTESEGGFYLSQRDVTLIRALSHRIAMVVNNAQVHFDAARRDAYMGRGSAPAEQLATPKLRAPLRLVSA